MKLLTDKKIIEILRCPICRSKMSVRLGNGASLICNGPRTHNYDFASSGYVNLCLPTQSGGGDSKAAVRARSDFLNLEYYKPVAMAVVDACKRYASPTGVVVDAGCGEGYYSSFIADAGFSVIGADLSKFAVDAASKRLLRRCAEKYFFATASVFDLPISDECADAVVNVFAPCAEDEYARVLKHDGVLIVAWAAEKHLFGLKNVIYKTAHMNTERADLPMGMKKIGEERVTYNIALDGNDKILNLFAMTPYYWRTSPDDAQKLKNLDCLETEVDITVSVYKKD